MEALLSFFSVLKSEVNWLISLVSSANTDTDQAQADVPAAHDNPPTDHMAAAAKDAVVQDSPAADTATATASHSKDEAPQLPIKLADDQHDDVHHAFDGANDEDSHPHLGGSVFAFDVPSVPDHPIHVVTPSPVSFALNAFDAFSAVNHASVGDLSVHPLPSFGGDVDETFSFKGSPAASGGQSSTGPAWTEYVTANSIGSTDPGHATGLTFKLTFDQSHDYLHSQDQDFQGAVEAVAQHLAGQYDNRVTVSIDVGYNEVEGFKLGSALGESITNYTSVTGATAALQYAALKGASNNYGSFLPDQDPLAGTKHTYLVTDAEGRALGISAAAPGVDGYIGILGGKQDFNLTPSATQYDGIGTIAHEFTEVMGRQTWNGAKVSGTPGYTPLDLFHFSSATPGTHIYSGSTAGYFSLDGTWSSDTTLAGDTARSFNTKVGDNSDWSSVSNGPADAYDASGGQGSLSPISHVDFLVMEAVGWHASGVFTGVWG